jgi:hypothetical protein
MNLSAEECVKVLFHVFILFFSDLVELGEPAGSIWAEAVEEESEGDGEESDEDVFEDAHALGVLGIHCVEGGCEYAGVSFGFHTHSLAPPLHAVNP